MLIKKTLLITIMIFNIILAKSQGPIKFIEEETIPVNKEFLSSIDMEELVIERGNYEVSFEENRYGTIYFNLQSINFSTENNSEIKVDGVGIRIAKRLSSNCKYECECGIGFRCGFITITKFNNTKDSRIVQANLTIYPKTKTLKLDFTREVNWSEL